MEEQTEKELKLLDKWMEYQNISKIDRIHYYQKLISYLEYSQQEWKKIAYKTSIGAGSIGIGTGLLINSHYDIKLIGSFFLLYGIISGFIPWPHVQKPDLEEYQEIEEKRELIKKWCRDMK
jgi:hypothetical protein